MWDSLLGFTRLEFQKCTRKSYPVFLLSNWCLLLSTYAFLFFVRVRVYTHTSVSSLFRIRVHTMHWYVIRVQTLARSYVWVSVYVYSVGIYAYCYYLPTYMYVVYMFLFICSSLRIVDTIYHWHTYPIWYTHQTFRQRNLTSSVESIKLTKSSREF